MEYTVPSQQYQLSVMDLTVQTSADGSATEAVSLQHLASWLHPGLITALQVGAAILMTLSSMFIAHQPDNGNDPVPQHGPSWHTSGACACGR